MKGRMDGRIVGRKRKQEMIDGKKSERKVIKQKKKDANKNGRKNGRKE